MKVAIKSRKAPKDRSKFGIAVLLFLLLVACIVVDRYLKPAEQVSPVTADLSLAGPRFSHPAGFYDRPFYLSLKHAEPGGKIYYTLDGTKPTRQSALFTQPFLVQSRADEPNNLSEIRNSPVFFHPLNRVFKGAVVRAITVYHDSVAGKESIATYFIHPQGRSRYSLPVFSLVTDEENFFGYKKGIYINGATTDDKDYYLKKNINIADYRSGFPANYKRRGEDWERPVHLSLFERSSNHGFQIQAGTRVHGNATRERPQKSLKFLLSAKFWDSALTYDLFQNQRPATYYSFLLRNAGQDMYKTMFRDGFMQTLLDGRFFLDIQHYRPAILFINGEYWGIYNIRERIDEHFFLTKYGIPTDSISILGSNIKLKRGFQLDYGRSSDLKAFQTLLKFVAANNMAIAENFKVVADQVDLRNLMDYVIAELYLGNHDWPNNNINLWRYRGKVSSETRIVRDGRWRWVLYDTDSGFGAETPASFDMVNYFGSNNEFGLFFMKLLQNPGYRHQFISRFEYHLDTSFHPSRVIGAIDAAEMVLAPEISEHLLRWRTLNSEDAWRKQVSILRRYARERPAFQRQELVHLSRQFESTQASKRRNDTR